LTSHSQTISTTLLRSAEKPRQATSATRARARLRVYEPLFLGRRLRSGAGAADWRPVPKPSARRPQASAQPSSARRRAGLADPCVCHDTEEHRRQPAISLYLALSSHLPLPLSAPLCPSLFVVFVFAVCCYTFKTHTSQTSVITETSGVLTTSLEPQGPQAGRHLKKLHIQTETPTWTNKGKQCAAMLRDCCSPCENNAKLRRRGSRLCRCSPMRFGPAGRANATPFLVQDYPTSVLTTKKRCHCKGETSKPLS